MSTRPECERLASVLPRALLACVLMLAGPWRDGHAEPGLEYISEWSTGGSDVIGMASDGMGHVYLTEASSSGNGRHGVLEYSESGALLNQWGSQGTLPGQFNGPVGIAVAPSGDVYVAEFLNDRIQHFTSAGAYLGMWGSQGSGPGQFD